MFSSFVLFGKILVAGAICRFVIVIVVVFIAAAAILWRS